MYAHIYIYIYMYVNNLARVYVYMYVKLGHITPSQKCTTLPNCKNKKSIWLTRVSRIAIQLHFGYSWAPSTILPLYFLVGGFAVSTPLKNVSHLG